MCGFAGILNSVKPLNRAQLAGIAEKVSFRGPDSCGIRILDEHFNAAGDSGKHALFFNRLAIVDLDPRSDQPFEDDRHMLIFNGEIYNYQSLKASLEAAGFFFNTTSDTEALFYALKHWGTEAIKKFNGMFAFCWIDKLSRQFIISRDRLGIKPLYYSIKEKSLVFGSELHSILRLKGEAPEISREAIDMYLWMQFIPTPFTAFRGIMKLPPGSFLQGSIDDNKTDLEPEIFWDAYNSIQDQHNNPGESLEEILKNSLERQLHADVPLGLFLSSGVDSSLIAAMMNKYFANDLPVNFFTVRFEENTASDESDDAKNFIAGFGNPLLKSHTMDINVSLIENRIDKLYDYYDEPFADPASLLNWAISEKAREHVTVAISGDGADELFWGYPRYNRWKKFEKISALPLLSTLARQISRSLPSSSFTDNLSFLFEDDPVKRHFNFFLPSGMRFKIRKPIINYPLWALRGAGPLLSAPDLPAILDIKTYLTDAMLYKVDRSSMASSLEVRVPYLDNEMLDLAINMPFNAKSTAKFNNKAPLKELLTSLAPHYDISKPKKGFSFPLEKWLKDHWKSRVLDITTKENLESAGLDPAPYLKIVHQFYFAGSGNFTDVWYIFNLMLWMNSIKKIDREI